MILLVDDEEVIRTIVSRVLRDEGFEVITAGTMQEAFRAAVDHGNRIRLAIVDLQMADGSGWDVAAQIWRQCPETNVLITSGFLAAAPPEDLAVPEGQLHFLSKPFQMGDLVRTVTELIER